jgi:LacI family transcriptional regulator
MADVAREANLSVASVSRVIGGAGARRVGEDVVEQVRNAAKKLGYQLDPIARALRNGRSGAVGLVVPEIVSPFFPALASSLESALRKADLSMFLLSSGNDPEIERECVSQLLARRVDTILISPVDRLRSRAAVEFAQAHAEVIQVDRFASNNAHRIFTDPVETVRLSIEHLVQQGYSRFAFVGAAGSSSVSVGRFAAYRKLINKLDLEGSQTTLLGDYSVAWGREASWQLVKSWPTVDAVVCASDVIALGVMQGLLEQGRDVPNDVAVTGCDDTFFASTSRPSITSVEQPIAALATHALELLSTCPRDKPQTMLLTPTLHIRESTIRQRNPGPKPKNKRPSV